MEHKMIKANSLLGIEATFSLIGILLISNTIGAYAQVSTSSAAAHGVDLSRCEIAFTDSRAAVLRADLATGGSEVIAQSQKLVEPLGICVGSSGEYFITDTGCFGVV